MFGNVNDSIDNNINDNVNNNSDRTVDNSNVKSDEDNERPRNPSLLVGQIRGKTSKTEKKKLGESKRETSKVKEGREIESEREKFEERIKIEEKRKKTRKSKKKGEMDRIGKGIDGGDENDVVCYKQTNKQLIVNDTNSAKDLLKRFVMKETDKSAREKRGAKIETYKLKRIERGTDNLSSA